MAVLLPQGKQQYFTSAGVPLVGGKLWTLDAGTAPFGFPRQTFSDAAGLVPNANPIILDARGEATIYWAGNYKVVLQDAAGATIWTQDNVSGLSGSNSVLDNYSVDSGVANGYVAAAATAINAYVAGLRVALKVLNTNTGPSTLNYMGLGLKNIVLQNGGALAGGELVAGGIYELEYDGVSFQILDPAVMYARTAQEILAGAVVADYTVPSHDAIGYLIPNRYTKNSVPGTTNMAPGVQACINIALSVLGSGKAGPPIRFKGGAYSIATALAFAGGANWLPIDIGGQGLATQLINNCALGTSALFNMQGCDGWYLHDFLMCGNSANKNDGIAVNVVGFAGIGWRIERVFSLMAGVGIKVADTNTGTIRDFAHWFSNNPDLIVPQVVNGNDISHGIYLTGTFCHQIHIQDPWCNAHSGYGLGNMRGIKMDCTFSFGVSIDGSPLSQTISGLNNEIGIDIAPTNSAVALSITGLYCEGATVRLRNVQYSNIGPFTNGEVGGALWMDLTCRWNKFMGIRVGVIDISDTTGTSQGNLFIGCQLNGPVAWVNTTAYQPGNYVLSGGNTYRCILAHTNQVPPNVTYWTQIQNFNDGNEGLNLSSEPNELIGVQGAHHTGYMFRKLLAYSANISMDVFGPNHNVIRVTNGVAFTINAPTHPRNGHEIDITIRNESGGAMGVITWNGIGVGGWVNPANGFNRTVRIYYDSDFGGWRQKWVGTADVAN